MVSVCSGPTDLSSFMTFPIGIGDRGQEITCKPGDVSLLPSGHDAWVVGDENVVVVDFQGMADYARKAG